MKLKTWLKGIREAIVPSREYEDVEFEDHEIGEGNVFKLHYVNYHRINGGPGYGVVDWPLKPFMIPDGMSREDAFKVLSYLTDFIEHNLNVGEASFGSVRALDSAIDIERFGFKRIDNVKNIVPAHSLYTVAGRLNRFKSSRYYNTYFEWYTDGVTREEVVSIYESIGLPFSDLVIKYDSVGHPFYSSDTNEESQIKGPVKKLND